MTSIQQLDEDSLKNFFSEFLGVYQKAILNNFSKDSKKFRLFNSMPAKIEILMDASNNYAIALVSKGSSSIVFEKFQDPLMVVATANSKKYEYGDMGKFLYLFQINSKTFSGWNSEKFAKDFMDYELLQFEKSLLV